MRRREKVSVKAAAIILGAALLTAGCSGYQSSEELRKNAENVQAEIVPGEENETENGSDEAIGEKAERENTEASVKQGSNPTAEIIQSETERTTAPAPSTKTLPPPPRIRPKRTMTFPSSITSEMWSKASPTAR